MRLLLALFCIILQMSTAAQDTLSYRNFAALSYSLNPGTNERDSTAIVKSFEKIAVILYSDALKFTKKPLYDSAMLSEVYEALITASIYKKDYVTALKHIEEARVRDFRKKFKAPPYILEKAFAYAMLNGKKTGFSNAFTSAYKADMLNVDKEFREDVANELKGVYGVTTATMHNKTVKDYVRESVDTKSPIIMYNMPYIMRLFFIRRMILEHKPVLQKLLAGISPAKVETEMVKIPMRDGIRLSGLVFRNVGTKEKLPVLVSQSPYPGGVEAKRGNIFAVNGYVYLYVYCRGKGGSEGEFFPYENDAQDYYDIIDWASKQRWSNGKVATTGGSYLGFTQWQAIRKEYRHPALKAINPMVAVGFGVDFPRLRQSFTPYSLMWAAYVQGKELNSALFDNQDFWKQKQYEIYKNRLPFEKLDSVAGTNNAFFKKWLQHPDFDEYWTNILPKEQDYAALDIPVLTTTGYFDGDQNGALNYYKEHVKNNKKNKHYVLIGPYGHDGAQWMPGPNQQGQTIDEEAQIPLYKYVIQWFDWALKGKPLPPFFADRISYYATPEKKWKSAPTLTKTSTDSLRLYLSPHFQNGMLTSNTLLLKPADRDTVYRYSHDINSVSDSIAVFGRDTSSIVFNAELMFESAALEKDYTVTGSCTAHLLASLNVPDADIVITFMTIDGNGKEQYLGFDILRTRYRYSGTHPQLMVPGKPEALHFNSTFFNVMEVKKGSRLRFFLQVRNDIWSEKNYGFGGVVSKEASTGPRLINVDIYTGKQSYISLPVQ